AVFAMGPRTSSEDDLAGSRKQLDHDLAKLPELEPFSIAIFGGVVDPAKLHFPFNRMAASDARDWDAIEAWALELACDVRTGARGRARSVEPRNGRPPNPRCGQRRAPRSFGHGHRFRTGAGADRRRPRGRALRATPVAERRAGRRCRGRGRR